MKTSDNKYLSVGLGTTLRCNLQCKHCYSRGFNAADLSLVDLEPLFRLPVSSINFGTGENGLNPHFEEILDTALQEDINVSITSNGYTVNKLSVERLAALHDLDISLDFADREKFDAFRGNGAWESAIAALEKSLAAGVETSLVMCLMNINQDEIVPILKICKSYDISLRINIYKPIWTKKFSLSYVEFWNAIRVLLDNARLVSCSEPVVNAMLNLPSVEGSPCGKTSIRIRPDKSVTPCVYWPTSDLTLREFYVNPHIIKHSQAFKSISYLPEICKTCEYQEICGGGCAARRKLEGDLTQPDPYCPIVQGEHIDLSYQRDTDRLPEDYVHSSYLCTFIVKPA
jgi:radical SAM protein with 4Fe4S-binding SPASM domain